MAYTFDLKDFGVNLSRMASKELDAFRKRMSRAAERGVKAFDSYAHTKTETHPPMAAHLHFSKRYNTITLAVSGMYPSFDLVKVNPGLETPTTGRNRRRVTVTGWTNRAVTVERGFVWNGLVQRRLEDFNRRFTSARPYLLSIDALPSPAQIFFRCRGEVVSAVMEALYGERD